MPNTKDFIYIIRVLGTAVHSLADSVLANTLDNVFSSTNTLSVITAGMLVSKQSQAPRSGYALQAAAAVWDESQRRILTGAGAVTGGGLLMPMQPALPAGPQQFGPWITGACHVK